MNHPQAESISNHIDKIRAIAEQNELTRQSLADIEVLVLEMAAQKEWWAESLYPSPASDELQARYLIQEDADQRFALYLNVMRPGKKIPPHNHTTWACIAAVEGIERNVLFERVHAGTEPGPAKLREVGQKSVSPGTAIALMPDDIHAVYIESSMIRHLHMYGRALETLSERLVYDVESESCQRMQVGVQTRRSSGV
ncbi:MAG: hypothetical protein ACO3C0_01125 [Burkholderiaceae bacterium]